MVGDTAAADLVAAPDPAPPAALASAVTGQSPDLMVIRRTVGLILLVVLTISFYFAKEVILPLVMGTLLALTLIPTAASPALEEGRDPGTPDTVETARRVMPKRTGVKPE